MSTSGCGGGGPARRVVRLLVIILLAATGLIASPAFALESDQFTLPPEPLADVGPELSEMLWAELEQVVEELNAEIDEHLALARISTTESGRRWRLRQADRLLSVKHLEQTIFRRLGRGFPEASIETMIRERGPTFRAQPALFAPEFKESIYRSSGFVRPLLRMGIVPSVNTYGVYVGADKFGHLLQQGYEYRRAHHKALRANRRAHDAVRREVQIGIDQERGVFGNLPSGTYSNADLAANFAGLKFYISLTEPVSVGSRLLQPLLLRTDTGWRFNEAAADRDNDRLLEPFISAHLSEAMNPPRFDWTMRESIRRDIRARAKAWLAHHDTTIERETTRLREMCKWFGEEYGHSGYKGVITVVDALQGVGLTKIPVPH